MEKFNGTTYRHGNKPSIGEEARHELGIQFNIPKDRSIDIIKVIGVGGGGCNAVSNMWKAGIDNITFAACNTDSQQLQYCLVPTRLQLGKEGLGVGGDPMKGREEAEASVDDIQKLLNDGTKMVFVTATMGGGTGTGAAPVVARVSREMGLLTIGIVTIPFAFEQRKKILKALRGVEEMRKNVDALLVVNNENLLALDGDVDFSYEEAFQEADNILKDAAKSISELITTYTPGCINVDFRDVETTLRNGGWAIMAAGRASGENRLARAFVNALSSPLLYGNDIIRAKRILIDVYTSNEAPMRIKETQQIHDFMKSLDKDIDMIFGTSKDESLGQDAKVIILAAGKEEDKMPLNAETEQDDAYYLALMEQLYPKQMPGPGQKKTEPEETEVAAAPEETLEEIPVEEISQRNAQEHVGLETTPPLPTRQPTAERTTAFKSFLERAQQWLLNLTKETDEQ